MVIFFSAQVPAREEQLSLIMISNNQVMIIDNKVLMSGPMSGLSRPKRAKTNVITDRPDG